MEYASVNAYSFSLAFIIHLRHFALRTGHADAAGALRRWLPKGPGAYPHRPTDPGAGAPGFNRLQADRVGLKSQVRKILGNLKFLIADADAAKNQNSYTPDEKKSSSCKV